VKKLLTLIFLFLVLVSCGNKPLDQLGSVMYLRGAEPCIDEDKNHWLLDLQARNSKDSLYQNTLSLVGKLEVHKLQLDTSSNVFDLLANTCKGDSIEMHLLAKTFYESLNGSVPLGMKPDEPIKVNIWVRDKLSDLQHIAYKKTFESHQMEQYVKANNWNANRDSTTEIYLDRLKQNKGNRGGNKKVLVSYIISNLNGKMLSKSTKDDLLVYSKKDKSILKGIQFIVNNLAVGESARALVPSDQAYGANGNEVVRGYTPVIIEIEVLAAID
jgi:FKBP-type peptidyl-prolyl cis-trans isomerase